MNIHQEEAPMDSTSQTYVKEELPKMENPWNVESTQFTDDCDVKESIGSYSNEESQNFVYKEENSNNIEEDPPSIPHGNDPNKNLSKKNSNDEEGKKKDRLYNCPQCDRTFKAEYRVEQHILCDHSKKKAKPTEKKTKCSTAWPCHLCDRKFMDKMNLNRHLATTHSDKTPYPCEMCPRKFKLGQYLLKHFTSAHCELENLYCEKCDRRFKDDQLIHDHVRKVHCRREPETSEDEAECTDAYNKGQMTSEMSYTSAGTSKKTSKELASAQKSQSSSSGRKKVEKKEKRGRKKKIQPSSTSVDEKSRVDVLSAYTTQTYWNCAICDRNLGQRKKVEEHLLAAHFEDCPEIPELENYYNVHTKYICNICDLRFGQKMNLNRHLLTTHCKETPFPCVMCKRKFKLRQYIKKHFLSVHCNVNDYICEKCETQFKDLKSLTEHVYKIHCHKKIIKRKKRDAEKTDQKSIVRKPKLVKGRSFKSDSDSEGEKNLNALKQKKSKIPGSSQLPGWDCEQCGREFSSKMNMERHRITVHSEEKPFKCSECLRSFKLLEYLRKHFISLHCRFSDHYCVKCDLTFGYKSSLLRHVYEVHCPLQKHPGQKRRRPSDSGSDEMVFPEEHPSVCPWCNEVFSRHKLLKKHSKICEKYQSFVRKENEKPECLIKREFECNTCQKVFESATSFAAHLKEDHNVQFFVHMCSRNNC